MNGIESTITDKLAEFGQQHLLAFWDELDQSQRNKLLQQIQGIDFQQIDQLYRSASDQQSWVELAQRAQPPPAFRLQDAQSNKGLIERAVDCGRQALADGKLATILVAGGQGSRLGFHHPKGMLPIGPLSKRTLFQMFAEKLLARSKQCGAPIPLYLMTSPATHDETVGFLDDHQWFHLPSSDRRVFCQGTMPAIDAETGKLLLSSKSELFLSPNGHGGMLDALQSAGCLDDLIDRGIEQVFYCQIDNPLVPICDPATIGFHLLNDAEMTLQAVAKREPLQKVGNIVSIDGQVQIIEYSDLPESVASQRQSDDSLRLWAGSIAVHVFNVEFLKRMTKHANALPFHLARKKVSVVDERGDLVKPESPNAIKFEKFIFDLLPLSRRSFVVEMDPAEAFAPVKNAATASTETAATCQQSLIAQARRRLREAGTQVADGIDVEINPLFAIDSEELKRKTAGMSLITEPTYLE